MNSWKAFSASSWLWKCLPCKKLLRHLKKWQSVGERSGAHSGWGETSATQFLQLLKHLFCDAWSAVVMEKNWALSADQCWLQPLQLSVHLIHLLSILLTCDGFAGIQKSLVDQTGSRPPNRPFFGENLALGSALERLLSLNTELIVTGCYMNSTFHCTSKSDWELVHYCIE